MFWMGLWMWFQWKLSAKRRERKVDESLSATEDAERLALSGPLTRHCPSNSCMESALYLHTPNLRQGLGIHRAFFSLLIDLHMLTIRHVSSQNILIPTHDRSTYYPFIYPHRSCMRTSGSTSSREPNFGWSPSVQMVVGCVFRRVEN